MDLTPNDKRLIRETFEALTPVLPEASAAFYATLFDLAPQLRPLFASGTGEQGMRFFAAIAFIVRNLDDPAAMDRKTADLGHAHAGFRLGAGDWWVVEEALFLTLRDTLGARFGAERQAAWRKALRQVCDAMADAGTPRAARQAAGAGQGAA